MNQINQITENWPQDEKYLVKIGTVLHKLRSGLPECSVYYFYTTESGKSVRFKITRNRVIFHLRVELFDEKCRLLEFGGKTYHKFDNVDAFTEHFNANVEDLESIIGD